MFCEQFLNLFSVRQCFACKNNADCNNEYLCLDCSQSLRLNFCKDKGIFTKTDFKREIYFATFYKDIARNLMKRFKYKQAKLYKLWADVLVKFWVENQNYIINKANLSPTSLFFVTEIPLHPQKERQRGFNQSGLIAEEFTKKMNSYQYMKNLLLRTKNTESLHNKTREERMSIVKEAFTINHKVLKSFKKQLVKKLKTPTLGLIIVDDITTTGCTLLEAYKTVHKYELFDEIILLACCGNR